jgi:hypothetical protein
MTEIFNNGENQQVVEIDRHDDVIMNGLKEAPVYRKQGQVNAKIAEGGEVVITKLADGTNETKNTANPGDAIITNPGGEQYIIGGEKFAKRYEPKEGEEGVFIAKGYCKAIDNPWEKPITMMASWGEMQNGQANCKIADTYDSVDKTTGGEPYIIGLSEFNLTYKIVEPQLNK